MPVLHLIALALAGPLEGRVHRHAGHSRHGDAGRQDSQEFTGDGYKEESALQSLCLSGGAEGWSEAACCASGMALVGPNGEPLSGDGSMGGKTPKNRTGGGKRRRNGRWSPNETTSLINLVRQYGKGKWKKILEEGGPVFNNRSQVQPKSSRPIILQRPRLPLGTEELCVNEYTTKASASTLCHPVLLKCKVITEGACLYE